MQPDRDARDGQTFVVEDQTGHRLGFVEQLADGRWRGVRGRDRVGDFDRPWQADQAVRQAVRARTERMPRW